jgi:phosphonopyruvate decarboxylase
MDESGRPYALLMQKGSVAAHALGAAAAHVKQRTPGSRAVGSRFAANAARPSRAVALREVVARTPRDSTAVLASTGFCGRELYAIDDRPNQLYMVGSMGCVLPLALGFALSRPDLRVVALDGDGAALMRMGAFATVGAYGPPNLQHLLLDNGVHDSTGGQATVSPAVSFANIASACGYASALETDSIEEIAAWLDAPRLSGARFARLLISAGTPADLPRPSAGPIDVKTRLMRHFRPSVGVH